MVVGDLRALPFRAAAFDVVVSRSVVEHLEDPEAVFRELRRIIRSGGRLLFTTPNRFYYSSFIAWMIPYAWKDRLLRWAYGELPYDHFPVFYRANTRRAFRRIAVRTGLRLDTVRAVRHFPHYLLFSPALFRLGMLYDWLITWLRLDDLQSTWLVIMERDQPRRRALHSDACQTNTHDRENSGDAITAGRFGRLLHLPRAVDRRRAHLDADHDSPVEQGRV